MLSRAGFGHMRRRSCPVAGLYMQEERVDEHPVLQYPAAIESIGVLGSLFFVMWLSGSFFFFFFFQVDGWLRYCCLDSRKSMHSQAGNRCGDDAPIPTRDI